MTLKGGWFACFNNIDDGLETFFEDLIDTLLMHLSFIKTVKKIVE